MYTLKAKWHITISRLFVSLFSKIVPLLSYKSFCFLLTSLEVQREIRKSCNFLPERKVNKVSADVTVLYGVLTHGDSSALPIRSHVQSISSYKGIFAGNKYMVYRMQSFNWLSFVRHRTCFSVHVQESSLNSTWWKENSSSSVELFWANQGTGIKTSPISSSESDTNAIIIT